MPPTGSPFPPDFEEVRARYLSNPLARRARNWGQLVDAVTRQLLHDLPRETATYKQALDRVLGYDPELKRGYGES